MLAGEANAVEHSVDAALAEAAGNENAVEAGELLFVAAIGLVLGFEAFGFHPAAG